MNPLRRMAHLAVYRSAQMCVSGLMERSSWLSQKKRFIRLRRFPANALVHQKLMCRIFRGCRLLRDNPLMNLHLRHQLLTRKLTGCAIMRSSLHEWPDLWAGSPSCIDALSLIIYSHGVINIFFHGNYKHCGTRIRSTKSSPYLCQSRPCQHPWKT